MNSNNLREMILYSLKKANYKYGMATYVIKNWVNYDFKKSLKTSKILYELKKMERDNLVKKVETSYKTQLSWKLI